MKNKQQSKIERPKEQKIIHRVYQEPKIRNKQRNQKEKKTIDTLKNSLIHFPMHVSVFVYVCIMVYVSVCNREGAKSGLKAKLRIIKTKK